MTNELLWLSDVHADILYFPLLGHYLRLRSLRPQGVLLTGDLSNARTLEQELGVLSSAFRCPIYFTLGNHDYYGGSIEGVQRLAREICSKHKNLIHLDHSSPVWVSKTTALIGVQGWGDGLAGLGKQSELFLNDRLKIEDFIGKQPEEYFALLRNLGRASAAAFLRLAPAALEKASHLIVATHVPPFVQSCAFRDAPTFLPFYTNMALGRAVLRIARQFPKKRISVYCGHTHRPTIYSPLPNVEVYVAKASYEVFAAAGRIRIDGGPT